MNDSANNQCLQETIANARDGSEKILSFVTGSPENVQLHEMERGIFQQLLALGASLLQIFLLTMGTGDLGLAHVDKNGVMRKRYGIKTRVYHSIFGTLIISRLCYWAKGMGSVFPLDAKLNLPDTSYSYLLQEWGISLDVQGSWEKVTSTLKNMLGLDLWGSCLERIAERTEMDVEGFYQCQSISQ